MQRVSIGRALVRDPAIYLMDEPLSSLDAKLRAELRVELKRVQADLGATLLYVTHDQIEAMSMATTIGVLDAGRLVQSGSPRDIYEKPREPLRRLPSRPAAHQHRCRSTCSAVTPRTGRSPWGCAHEHLVQGEGMAGTVTRVEHLGDQTRLHLSLGGHDIVTLSDVHTPAPHRRYRPDSSAEPVVLRRRRHPRHLSQENVPMSQFINAKENGRHRGDRRHAARRRRTPRPPRRLPARQGRRQGRLDAGPRRARLRRAAPVTSRLTRGSSAEGSSPPPSAAMSSPPPRSTPCSPASSPLPAMPAAC